MSASPLNTKRVLAIDPSPKGFGFVVLEGAENLIDWGVKSAGKGGKEKNAASLRRVADLIERSQPDVVVVEDPRAKGCRRRPRVRELLDCVLELARERRVKARRFSIAAVRSAFLGERAGTKHDIATIIASRFPALGLRLPPRRVKCYDSEAMSMRMFDAAALALTYFDDLARRRGARGVALRRSAPPERLRRAS